VDQSGNKIMIDFTPFICEAFASNPAVYKTIEKMYEKNRVKYYQTAKKNKWYNHELLTSQSISKEIVMKRTLGILLEGDPDEVLQIIKKGWKSIYSLVNSQAFVIPSEIVFKILPPDKAGRDKLDTLTNDEFNSYAMVIITLASIQGKKLDEQDEFYSFFIQNCHARLQWADEGLYRFSLQSVTQENRKKVREFKEKIYAEMNINRFWVSHTNQEASEEMQQISNALSFLFDTEGLAASIIEDEPLSETDIEEILAAYFITFKNQNKIEGAKFLAAGHIIKSLLRAYRHLKEQHFKTSRETLYLDLDTAQHEAKEARLVAERQDLIITQKNREIENLQKQVASEYGRAVNEYRDNLKEAEKEISDLQQRLSSTQAELEELSKIILSEFEPEENLEPVDLSTVRGIIVGGRDRWHARMKEVLPDTWRLIPPDNEIDLAVIAKANIVFFFTGYLSHAVYYAVIGEARKKNIPVGYIKRINETECLAEIQNQVRPLRNKIKEA